jgi:hypothetical protein
MEGAWKRPTTLLIWRRTQPIKLQVQCPRTSSARAIDIISGSFWLARRRGDIRPSASGRCVRSAPVHHGRWRQRSGAADPQSFAICHHPRSSTVSPRARAAAGTPDRHHSPGPTSTPARRPVPPAGCGSDAPSAAGRTWSRRDSGDHCAWAAGKTTMVVGRRRCRHAASRDLRETIGGDRRARTCWFGCSMVAHRASSARASPISTSTAGTAGAQEGRRQAVAAGSPS